VCKYVCFVSLWCVCGVCGVCVRVCVWGACVWGVFFVVCARFCVLVRAFVYVRARVSCVCSVRVCGV
jgi:predicted branched-subunit amino acid permease